ncbi:phosphotriesterase [uncultured Arcticibacterium sp.]|uniref:phosphotriesterase family protein n=1 Tax=uncultured Arcticibacterium sp. TaxID=2173042 RepID=UPI0030F8CE15
MKTVVVKIFLILNLVVLQLACQNDKKLNQINTVKGPVDVSELGISLTHEHIMSNFGSEMDEALNYDSVKLFNQVIPYLKELKTLGVQSIFDCTTEYFGRRVDLLEVISDSSGVQIITNTGFYGAANDRYIPAFAYEASAESISEIWIDEFENGIKGTAIKPGFIKLAFDDGMPPSNIDKKLFSAGLLSHLSTGLTLAVHTGANLEAAKLQMELLSEYNIHPSAWIWTHASKLGNDEILIEFASKGAWISLDGVNENNCKEYIERMQLFKRKKLLNKVLLSHDGNSFRNGGGMKKFEAIFKNLIPEMRKNGFTEDDINQITVRNPKEAFGIKIRMTKN